MRLRAAILAGLLGVSGCATTTPGLSMFSRQGEEAGARKSASEMVDAMAGGLIGGNLGKGLDDKERRKALETEYRALEYGQSGQSVTWKGSDEGRSGTVVPAQPYRVGSQDCRQYSHTVEVNGTSQTARGTACRNADGSWTTLS